MCQMKYRRNAVMRRVRTRIANKRDAAARCMQYYCNHAAARTLDLASGRMC